jgi:hypothetical protein
VLLSTEGSEWCNLSARFSDVLKQICKRLDCPSLCLHFLFPPPLHWRSWQALLLARRWDLTAILPPPQPACQRGLLQNYVRYHFLFLFLGRPSDFAKLASTKPRKVRSDCYRELLFLRWFIFYIVLFLWS